LRIGYARLARLEKEGRSQLEVLTAAGCEHVFIDRGVTGIAVHKPALIEATAAARPGGTLVVCSLDRLARNIGHLIGLIGEFEAAGIGFASLLEEIDTSSAPATSFYPMMRALALFETNGARDRILARRAAEMASAAKAGRPPAISDTQWAAMKVALLKPDVSIATIASAAGINRSLIYYRLAQEVSDESFALYRADLARGAAPADTIARLGLFAPAVAYRESQARAAARRSPDDELEAA